MPVGTTASIGTLKAANELRVPVVGPYSGAAPAAKYTEYGFPVRISFDEEYGRIVDHLESLPRTRPMPSSCRRPTPSATPANICAATSRSAVPSARLAAH